MDIEILQLIEGAKQAVGLAVVIDVFRAFSTACYAVAQGAERIIPVGDLDLAYGLKKENPHYLLIGERKGWRPSGFDYGNSPSEIEAVDFSRRTVVQTTSAGTQGIANALRADKIITGSFVNAPAIVDYIRSLAPQQISLVCMGREALEPSDEDTLCACYIRDSLLGRTPDFEPIRSHLKGYQSAAKFFDPEKTWAPERDFELCMDIGRFDFVLVAQIAEDGIRYLRKMEVRRDAADRDHVSS